MKEHKQTILVGLGLLALSAFLHYVHYLIFHDIHHVLIYLLGDIAFIPLEVFFVTVVLERIIAKRDEKHMIKKLNMLVGLFYQELGQDLLKRFVSADPQIEADELSTTINHNWCEDNYIEMRKRILKHDCSVNIYKVDLAYIDDRLTQHKVMITNMISNPAIHEHGPFSEVLMSVFHLSDELRHRPYTENSKDDLDHLKVDIDRVYKQMAKEWVAYMSHMQNDYPYLFSTAIKNNPFDPKNRYMDI